MPSAPKFSKARQSAAALTQLASAARLLGFAVVTFAAVSIVSAGSALAIKTGLADALEDKLREPFNGDLDAILERGYLRVLVPFSKTFYFIDNGVQRGTTVDMMDAFAKHLDKHHGKKALDDQLVMIPTPRENLFTDLAEGRGDMALGNLTITPERQDLVAFSVPIYNNVKEVPMTAADAQDIASAAALSGMDVHVRPSSSYYDSLLALNEKLEADGKAPVNIIDVGEVLQDEDLMDMVQAGALGTIIVDQHKGAFWMQILDGLKMHEDAPIRTDGQIAFAVRKDAPDLLKEVSAFAKTVEKGTLLGNIILKRYLTDADYLKKLESGDRQAQYDKLSGLFQKYGLKYDIDWLLVAAQAYQESQYKIDARSSAGAVGLMQIKPSTAAGQPIGIKGVESDPDKNVEAGVKYLRYLADTYFDDLKSDPANQTFFALAAYNAGPSRFDRLRKEAAKSGYDPDKWFGNVEWTVARRISREPVRYVGNIYKYYVAFAKEAERREAVKAAAPDAGTSPD
ncbi:membrane-bound lytic murein transglycosylase MltF [Roseibium hamelinense]|uniref:Membrane-bound lytic murein transglycosylase MltF n=1 Tax=Roseibium hamelinense TaxID=150831 RepID=A0A562T8V5_9HYPH|nr:transporter substrate-binding domain-containing protein [Roseibium hamelinense]MTI43678.1 transporter substrate-binding domain-containing protein [Roseibium hamelinense]TWI89356.1 membrane-bound lytic murein transglycosylase MltF [Roseibium hamelinense]